MNKNSKKNESDRLVIPGAYNDKSVPEAGFSDIVSKKDSGILKILVTRLTPEKTVSLSFSHKFIFDLLKSRFKDSVFVDYFFFPEHRQFINLKNNKFQGALSQNARIDISRFDIIAVSNSFQLELFNLFHLFSMLKTPFKLKERLNDETAPLIIAGGVNTPSIAALTGSIDGAGLADDGSSSLIDAIFMGEAETNLTGFIQTLLDNPGWKKSKYEMLDKASQNIAGIYFPPKYIHEFEYTGIGNEIALKAVRRSGSETAPFTPARAAYIENIDEAHEFIGAIYDDSPNRATAPVEITRGCASMCSFCKEGYTQKPYREKSAAKVIAECRNLRDQTGISRFNLYSYNFNDHSHIHEIVEGLASNGMEAEVKSQRADTALKMPKLLSYLQTAGSASPTFAIEGISDRIRSRLSKNLDSKTVNGFADSVFINKPRQLKLFFIITGLENEADLSEFNDFFARLIKNRKAHSPSSAIVISLMPLVLCQKTPLMFAAAPDAGLIYKIIEKIFKNAGNLEKVIVRSSIGRKLYEITAITEYGGREITGCLYDLAVNAGFVYYEDIDDKSYNRFIESVKKAGFAFSKFNAEKNFESVFNSDDREYGVTKNFLYKAWVSAKNFKDMPRCLRNSSEKCFGCGACGGDVSVYENTGGGEADKDFNVKSETGDNKIRMVLPAVIGEKTEIPHRLISLYLKNAAFKIIEDSISKLSLNADKFSGKNFYLIESAEALDNLAIDEGHGAKCKPGGLKSDKGFSGGECYKSLDFLLECNYIFAKTEFNARFFKRDAPDKSAVSLFNRLNPKFKLASIKSGGNSDFIFYLNADGLKKRPAMPLIMMDKDGKLIYSLFKLEKETLDIIDKAEVIEYIKFYEYNVKDAETICGECGRVMSSALGHIKNFSSKRCFICELLS